MPAAKDDPRRKGRSTLPFTPAGGGGYKMSVDKGRMLTFGYFANANVSANIVGDEEGNDLYLILRPASLRSIRLVLNLTMLKEDELKDFKDFVSASISAAMPVVQARDKEAQNDFENGDDSNYRLHRAAPTLSLRTGALIEYSDRLRLRPSGFPGVEGEPSEPADDEAGRAGNDGRVAGGIEEHEVPGHSPTPES